jgi:methylmalonyl-CoA epimerase
VVPGTGDEVQALKAGIMEIADIFVVNKADREGADRTAASIETMLSLERRPEGEWRPPVLRTVATSGAGVAQLAATIAEYRAHTESVLAERRRGRAEWRLREVLGRAFMQHVERDVLRPGEFEELLTRIARREIDPYGAAATVMSRATTLSASTEMSLDHVGIAVPDAAELVALFRRLFGLTTGEPEDVGQHRVRFVQTGDATLELVEPLSESAPVAVFLQKRGSGLHHVCLRVRDINRTMEELIARGVRFIDTSPRSGAHGSRIAFIHPSSAGGVLVELKET